MTYIMVRYKTLEIDDVFQKFKKKFRDSFELRWNLRYKMSSHHIYSSLNDDIKLYRPASFKDARCWQIELMIQIAYAHKIIIIKSLKNVNNNKLSLHM